jgi:hypothetical protein
VRSPARHSGLRAREEEKERVRKGQCDVMVLVEHEIVEEERWRRLTAVDRGAPVK